MTTKHPAMLVRRLLVGAIALATAATTLTIVAAPAQADTPPKPARTWGTNGRVNYILPVGDQVFVGGEFTSVIDTDGGSHPVSNIAVFSASTGAFDLSWQGSANGLVNALAADPNGVLYIGGLFSKVDGVNASRVAALDAATARSTPTSTPAPTPRSTGSRRPTASLFMSGLFSSVTDGSGAHARSFIAKLNGDTGTVDMGWTVTPNDRTRALSVTPNGSQLFFAGDFKKVNDDRHGEVGRRGLDGNPGCAERLPAHGDQRHRTSPRSSTSPTTAPRSTSRPSGPAARAPG